MSKRPEDYTKAQLIDLVGDLEAQLNDVYGVDKSPAAEDTRELVATLKISIAELEAQVADLEKEKAERALEPANETLQAAIRELEAQLAASDTQRKAVEAELQTAKQSLSQQQEAASKQTDDSTVAKLKATIRDLESQTQTLKSALAAAGTPSAQPAGELAKAMQATDLDQPIYATLYGATYDLTEAAGIEAVRNAISRTLGDTGILLVKLLQHRSAQERFQELSSVLPGGGHNTARMAKLGAEIASASQRLTESFVDGKAVSQLISRLYQERGVLDQCIQSLQGLDMETRRHAKGEGL